MNSCSHLIKSDYETLLGKYIVHNNFVEKSGFQTDFKAVFLWTWPHWKLARVNRLLKKRLIQMSSSLIVNIDNVGFTVEHCHCQMLGVTQWNWIDEFPNWIRNIQHQQILSNDDSSDQNLNPFNVMFEFCPIFYLK